MLKHYVQSVSYILRTLKKSWVIFRRKFWSRLASGYVPLITDMISGKSGIAQVSQFLRQMTSAELEPIMVFTILPRASLYVSDMLTPAADVTSRAMRSSTNCDYFVRWTTLRLGDRAFSVAAPEPGIGCHQNWRRRARSKLSRDASKLFI